MYASSGALLTAFPWRLLYLFNIVGVCAEAMSILQHAVNTTLVHPTISTVHGDQIVFNYDINHGKNELVEDMGERILSYL